MDTTSPTIPAETANHVLFHFGHGGYQPGTFTQHLISAIATADMDHKAKLALGFPDYVAAVIAMEYDPDGAANLQKIALALRCTCGDTDGPFKEIDGTNLCEGCIGVTDEAQ